NPSEAIPRMRRSMPRTSPRRKSLVCSACFAAFAGVPARVGSRGMSKSEGGLAESRRVSIDLADHGRVLALPGRDARCFGPTARVRVPVVAIAGTLPIVAPDDRRDAGQLLRSTRLADLAEGGVQLSAAVVRGSPAADRVRELAVRDRALVAAQPVEQLLVDLVRERAHRKSFHATSSSMVAGPRVGSTSRNDAASLKQPTSISSWFVRSAIVRATLI